MCKATSPFWGYLYLPPFSIKGKIYPPMELRQHFSERLGMNLEGCNDIYAKDRLSEILQDEKWLPVERMILESWHLGDEYKYEPK
jgi:hypothetical protein